MLLRRDNLHVWAALFLCLGLAACGGAAPNVQDMIVRLSEAYEPIWKLLTAVAYLLGIMLIFRAMYHLKIYGELRTMMAAQGTGLKTPIMFIVAGASLIYLPTSFDILSTTIFNTSGATPLSYTDTGTTGYAQAMTALLGFIQIVGLISFVRGWTIIAKSSSQGQHASAGKGWTHIIAGVLAINIVGTRDVLFNTLGISF